MDGYFANTIGPLTFTTDAPVIGGVSTNVHSVVVVADATTVIDSKIQVAGLPSATVPVGVVNIVAGGNVILPGSTGDYTSTITNFGGQGGTIVVAEYVTVPPPFTTPPATTTLNGAIGYPTKYPIYVTYTLGMMESSTTIRVNTISPTTFPQGVVEMQGSTALSALGGTIDYVWVSTDHQAERPRNWVFKDSYS